MTSDGGEWMSDRFSFTVCILCLMNLLTSDHSRCVGFEGDDARVVYYGVLLERVL